MSDDMTSAGFDRPGSTSGDESHKVDAVKHEAAAVKDTAMEAEKAMLGTVKDEAASVAQETKAQAKDLFAQTRQELTDQAATQQERMASGLRAMGDELGSMAEGGGGSGVAADLVRQVSERMTSAGAWLGDRSPEGVLADVRAFARRRPAAFIGGALLAGIAAGRLTRALAANAKDESATASNLSAAPTVPAIAPAPVVSTVPAAPVPPAGGYVVDLSSDDSPLYAETVGRHDASEGGSNERSDTF